jgi:membrane-associated PAP2 superfamily phosphatase
MAAALPPSPPPSSGPAAPGVARAPRRGWRARSRAGWTGLAVALLLAWIFTLWPQLDLWVSGQFRNGEGRFVDNAHAWAYALYWAMPKIGWAYFIAALVAIALGRRWPGRVSIRWRRRATSLALVSGLGSWLVVNALLKEHWGRARPRDVAELVAGAPHHFSIALSPVDQCLHNCSFTSGHAASGFVIMAVGLMGSVATRRRWLAIGLGAGALASAGRVVQGAHFLSDTLFAGVAIWATGWIVRECWLRLEALRRRRVRLAATGPGA